jgi:hypothetical protein
MGRSTAIIAAYAAPPKAARSKRRLAPGVVADAVIAAEGNVTVAAERLGCHRRTIDRQARRSAIVAMAVVEARERALDTAESMLMNAVHQGEAWAICFFLKTQGRARGYVERQELTHRVDPEAPITFIQVNHRAEPGGEATDAG